MSKRPNINEITDSHVFLKYYFLLDELKQYCKANNMPASGNKQMLTERIAHYIDAGEILGVQKKEKQASVPTHITVNTPIESNIKCSESHRAFFKGVIGKSFSFNVAFQNWLKENSGKTYGEAIEAYKAIKDEKKTVKTVISKQFEYNTYIRDFFAANTHMKLEDAIRCWKYKKELPGHNRYEKSDLVALRV